MERIRRTLRPARGYQPIDQGLVTGQSPQHGLTDDEHREEKPFLWIEYWIFMLLGLAMLWAWYVSLPFRNDGPTIREAMAGLKLTDAGICSSQLRRTFNSASLLTNGFSLIFNRPKYQLLRARIWSP